MSASPIDRMRTAAASERVTRALGETLRDLADGDIRELAEALTTLADNLDTAASDIEEWADEEDREARVDARENAVVAVEEAVEAWDAVEALLPLEGVEFDTRSMDEIIAESEREAS